MFSTPDSLCTNTGTMPFSPEYPSFNAHQPRVTPLTNEVSLSPSDQELTAEELVAKLREQLSLQQQLSCQFEVDLNLREEQVSLLTAQLKKAEADLEKYFKEIERRQAAMRSLRRKVNELEKMCRKLEEEVERSREESFDRSIMDEASEGALRVLHSSIGQLKAELDKAKADGKRACEASRKLEEDVAALSTERQRLECVEKELQVGMESKDNELKRLQKQVHDLQQESADKEVKLLQLHKARAQDKEDKDGLNIALDSKQQELELLKRKIGVKGTGGSTPAPNRVGLPESSSRRQSLAFATPSITRPRPSSGGSTAKSALSESPTKKEASALRTSTLTTKTTRMRPPPVALSRGTPSSTSPLSLIRSASSGKTPSVPISSVPHRRSSSVVSSTASNITENNEKENTQPIKIPVARKRMLVPV